MPRSWLLVPADNEEKIALALASDADALIFDLEDSVAPNQKAKAREVALNLLARPSAGPERWVRINPLDGDLYGADLACCEQLEIAGLVLPKAESGAQIKRLAGDVLEAGWKIHAMVAETAISLFQLQTFQGSAPQLTTMSWGIDDLAAALGASSKFDSDGGLSFTYRMARSLSLAAARAAGVEPIDAVFRDLDDQARLKTEAEAARREGFTGKLAIDVSQVKIINAAFSPTAAEIAASQAIVDRFNAEPGVGMHQVGSRLVDRARLLQARSVLDRAH